MYGTWDNTERCPLRLQVEKFRRKRRFAFLPDQSPEKRRGMYTARRGRDDKNTDDSATGTAVGDAPARSHEAIPRESGLLLQVVQRTNGAR